MAPLVFLDFDGVICDSALECLVTSWEAYFAGAGGLLPAAVPVELKSKFLKLRPYVRSGEDFVLCQDIIHEGLTVSSQAEFDRLAAERGPGALARFRESFNRARARLLEEDRPYWISLNRLYPWVPRLFARFSASPCAYILSTKRPEYIDEILRASGIVFPRPRILYAGKTEKGARIEELLGNRNAEAAVIVDDQIDHLAAIQRSSSRIRVYLAAWGYVRPEWLVDCPMPVLRMSAIGNLLESLLGPCEP